LQALPESKPLDWSAQGVSAKGSQAEGDRPQVVGMRRLGLTDAQWERIASLLPPKKTRTGRPAEDHRQMLDGMLWILRTGAPWEDLPVRYGPVGLVSSRFYRWRADAHLSHKQP
jgi:Putative transposase of IS4/5 family (DUF4096)